MALKWALWPLVAITPPIDVVSAAWQLPQAALALFVHEGFEEPWHEVAHVLSAGLKVVRVEPETSTMLSPCSNGFLIVELPVTVAEWQVSQLYPLLLTCVEWALVTSVAASPWQTAQLPLVAEIATENDDVALLWE